eukprot:1136985-Pelagomonas_calceolata.AAC.5
MVEIKPEGSKDGPGVLQTRCNSSTASPKIIASKHSFCVCNNDGKGKGASERKISLLTQREIAAKGKSFSAEEQSNELTHPKESVSHRQTDEADALLYQIVQGVRVQGLQRSYQERGVHMSPAAFPLH